MKKTLFLSLFLWSNLAFSELVDRAVAIVGKELILKSDVDELMRQNPAATFKSALDLSVEKAITISECKKLSFYPSETEVKQQIKDIMKQYKLDEAALTKELARMGMTYSGYEAQLYSDMCKGKLIQNKIRNRVNITKDDVQRAYDQKNGSDAQLRLRSLLLQPKTKRAADKEEAKKQSLLIVQRLKSGTPFDKVVSDSQKEGSKITSEELDGISKSDLLPHIADAVFSLSTDKIRGPIETDDGFHIFEVLERAEASRKPLVDEEKDLHKQLFEREVERLLKQYIEESRSSTFVDVMESANS